MNGGTISGNTAPSGGGVCVWDGTFTMTGGTVSENTANQNGGGVEIWAGTFTMQGGTFTMKAGTISGNTAGSGGGVCVEGGNFTMNDGTISGNTGTGIGGGGVYANGNDATFTKTGRTVYGDDNTTHTPGSTENTATAATNGHAVFLEKASPAAYYYRNETLTGADNISTTDPLPGTSGQPVGNWTKR
jgi:hypothetical protein